MLSCARCCFSRRSGSILAAGDGDGQYHSDHGQAASPSDKLQASRGASKPGPHGCGGERPSAVGDQGDQSRDHGRIAAKRITALGLAKLTTNPSRIARR